MPRGPGAPATSAGVVVAVNRATLKCPKPTGRLSGSERSASSGWACPRRRRASKLKRFGVTHNAFDNFCLYAGWGIRAGYPSTKLLASLPARERKRVTGIILLLTANPYYALDRTRPGATLTKRSHGASTRQGVQGRAQRLVHRLRARGPTACSRSARQVIQEVGIADGGCCGGRKAQLRFLGASRAPDRGARPVGSSAADAR